jgi:hypothetical protein
LSISDAYLWLDLRTAGVSVLVAGEFGRGFGDSLNTLCFVQFLAERLKQPWKACWNHQLKNIPLVDNIKINSLPPNARCIRYSKILKLISRGCWSEIDPYQDYIFAHHSFYWPNIKESPGFAPFNMKSADLQKDFQRRLWNFFEVFLTTGPKVIERIKARQSKGLESVVLHVRFGDHVLTGRQSWTVYRQHLDRLLSLTNQLLKKRSTTINKQVSFVCDAPSTEIKFYVAEHLNGNLMDEFDSTLPKHAVYAEMNAFDWDKLFTDFLMMAHCDLLISTPNSQMSKLAAQMAHYRNPNFAHYVVADPNFRSLKKADEQWIKRCAAYWNHQVVKGESPLDIDQKIVGYTPLPLTAPSWKQALYQMMTHLKRMIIPTLKTLSAQFAHHR